MEENPQKRLKENLPEDSELQSEEENPIDNWVIVFESPVFMEAELVEARFDDEGIGYYTINKQDLGYTVEIGTYWTYNAGKPITIFVRPEDEEKARLLIEEDRSNLLDDPNLDFGTPEES